MINLYDNRDQLSSYLNEILEYKEEESLAIVSDEEQVTWLELSERIHEWYKHYKEYEIPDNVAIVLYGHKEVDFLIAMYAAVLYKIPFVPVDVIYPKERLKEICTEISAPYYFDVKAKKFISTGLKPLSLEEKNLAYIMFTSGSTGRPKGVQIGRESVWNLIQIMKEDFAFDQPTVFMNQAPFSFDLSMYEVFGTLAYRGTCILNSVAQTQDRSKWYSYLKKYGVTVWVSTPSFIYQQLIEDKFDSGNLPSLQDFLFCGEPLSKTIVKKLYSKFPQARVLNTYGPTEATVATTYIEITSDILNDEARLLPIGKPMLNTKILLEGDEIIISGPNVMRGYLNLPQENQEKLYQLDGFPCFRTGDLGSYYNGLFYCHGRKDSQIKLNGFRIELREVENRILSIPEVSAAHIVPISKSDGSIRRLVAFCIATISVDAIFEKLNNVLPPYMIPSQIILIDSVPMTINGKVDNQKLLEILKK